MMGESETSHEVEARLKSLADEYNELVYSNKLDPAESTIEFFKWVGILGSIAVFLYIAFFALIFVLFS